MRRLRCILLGLIPIINFGLQYYFTKKDGLLTVFKKHWTCYRGDRIFLPINILVPFLMITVSREITVILFLCSLILNGIIHYLRSLQKDVKHSHIVTPKITKAGRIHMIFSTIETVIIFLILTSTSGGQAMYTEIGLVIVFIGILNYGELRIHKKLYRSDVLVSSLLGITVLIKFITLR